MDKKKGFCWKNLVIVVLLLAVVISGIGLVRERMASKRQRELQESLAQLASQTTEERVSEIELETEPETEPETEAAYVSPVDFEALREQNADTVAWITVPGTSIDYPIVQYSDNDRYLHTDFDGKESVYGAIYLDCDSEPDFSGWNHPIYGHHMRDGSMFKDVVNFKDEAYFKEHQFFEIYTPERTIHLKAVACYYGEPEGIVRKTSFKTLGNFDAWMKERLAPCSFAQMPPQPVDKMFVLVTCSYEFQNARTLLYAVEVDEEGNEIPADLKHITEKPGALSREELEAIAATAESGGEGKP